MGEKISYALKKCKSVLIIVLILWVVLSIVFVVPVSVSYKKALRGRRRQFCRSSNE